MNLRRLILSLYLLLILGLGVAAGVYFLEARAEYDRLHKVEVENQRRLAKAQEEVKKQEKILERMRTDPEYVERIIRQRLGYGRPGENLYRFEN